MKCLAIVLLASMAFGQSLPDAPSATRQCWVVDDKAEFYRIDCEFIPRARPSQNWRVIENQPYHTPFFKTRRWTDPPLRMNRETLSSKSFYLPEIAMWGSTGADLARNHGKPGVPKGFDLFLDAGVPGIVTTAAHWMADRFLWRPIGLGAVGYVTFIHTRSAIDGVYH